MGDKKTKKRKKQRWSRTYDKELQWCVFHKFATPNLKKIFPFRGYKILLLFFLYCSISFFYKQHRTIRLYFASGSVGQATPSLKCPMQLIVALQQLVHTVNIKYGCLILSINNTGFLLCQLVSRSSSCANKAFYFTVTWCDWFTLIG